ncbi:MAG: hypothetical protein WDA17_05545 [Sphaerochaetaceae bacterium]
MGLKKKIAFISVALIISLVPLFATGKINGELKATLTTTEEITLETGYAVKMATLRGKEAPFDKNGFKLGGKMAVSPISVVLSFDTALNPIYFVEIGGGAVLGTGWNFDRLNFKGLAIGDGGSDITHDSLGGLYYNGYGTLTFSFDTKPFFDNDWLRFSLDVYQEVGYKGYTAQRDGKGWDFNQKGLYRNGLSYKGRYLLTYKMPIAIDSVGLIFETRYENIKNSFDVGMVFDLALFANLNFKEHYNLTVKGQMTTEKIDSETRKISNGAFGFRKIGVSFGYSF